MAQEPQGANGGTELGRFLRARRAQVTPEHAGIGVGPGWRRTPGLRREELAALAGVSVDYYIRLERGKEHRPSHAVIDALAAALRLDANERGHLFAIATRATSMLPKPSVVPDECRPAPGTDLLLERLRPYPARVLSRTLDLLACNPGGLRTLPGIEDWPVQRRNVIRYVFLHPAARALFPDWKLMTSGCVARLRAVAGREPDAPDVTELVAELATASTDFAWLWDRYEVRPFTGTSKTLHHPQVGTMTLTVQAMQIEGTAGHRLVTYLAEPGTPDHDALVLLDR
ncbi:helix-turn-helix transcriptional regulator [Actinoplanes sp. NBC_00393]|uniref:helix-turn-helix domain-containing protein n=1 Tax=Actinoplanes sp. NBC_00393 TaxID=2975953 RepID=UPI002E1B06C0